MENNKFLLAIYFTIIVNFVVADYYGYNPQQQYLLSPVPAVSYLLPQVSPPEENLDLKFFELLLSDPDIPKVRSSQSVLIESPYHPNLLSGYSYYSAGQILQTPVIEIQNDLNKISQKCSRNSVYTSYDPDHGEAVAILENVLFKIAGRDFKQMLNLAGDLKARPEINTAVWHAAVSRYQAMNMPKTLSLYEKPSSIYSFPLNFFPDRVITAITQDVVILDETFGEDNGIENLLWYFREDAQLNAYHSLWHSHYPQFPNRSDENSNQAIISRRGEAFYFFHHELMARYEAERISNGLPPVSPLDMDETSPIEGEYNPHLIMNVSHIWAPRKPILQLSSALTEKGQTLLKTMIKLKENVIRSLKAGLIIKDNVCGVQQLLDYIIGTKVTTPCNGNIKLDSITDNINIIGEKSEASDQTINPTFYGSKGYHSQGHCILSMVQSIILPGIDQRGVTVMGELSTALRDPVFYNWHKYVDNLFGFYKAKYLLPYYPDMGNDQLVFPGVAVKNFHVADDKEGKINHLHTFWNFHRFDIGRGRQDKLQPANVSICAKHLDHQNFTYYIRMQSEYEVPIYATVRIYMAPRFKTKEKDRYTMNEQRTRFFTMDIFKTTLLPGISDIIRNSNDSELTAPWPRPVEEVLKEKKSGGGVERKVDCDCGYPHHLLLPKGSPYGTTFDLFVMVTPDNLELEKPPLSSLGYSGYQNYELPECTSAHIHCGIPGNTFPDPKPMGYPFDRVPFSVPSYVHQSGQFETQLRQVSSLEEYVSHIPNAATTPVIHKTFT